MAINRFEVNLVNLDPTVGREIKKTRPGLVVSPDEMNHHPRTVIARIDSPVWDRRALAQADQGPPSRFGKRHSPARRTRPPRPSPRRTV